MGASSSIPAHHTRLRGVQLRYARDVCSSIIPSACTIRRGTRFQAPTRGVVTLEDGGVLIGSGFAREGTITETTELEGPGTFASGATISGRVVSRDGTMTNGTFEGNSRIRNTSITTSVTVNDTAELAPGAVVTADLTNTNGYLTSGVLNPSSEITNVVMNGTGSVPVGTSLTNSSGNELIMAAVSNGVPTNLVIPPGGQAVFFRSGW